ncbi:MAG: Phospholipid hydroperoxide glutathione peroxidase, mitochondrial [Marteilia pararefringens]
MRVVVNSLYELEASFLNYGQGKIATSLEHFRNSPLVIANVATNCKLAEKNLDSLKSLNDSYALKIGLKILLFPSNTFNKESRTNEEIKQYFTEKYPGTIGGSCFYISEKISVFGNDIHPLFQYLIQQQPGMFFDSIKWNYTKFYVNMDGLVVHRMSPVGLPIRFKSTFERILIEGKQ